MRTNLLLFILAIATTVAFGQTKETPKSEEKPMRKIASGNGAKQIEEQVGRDVAQAMHDLEIELDGLDVRINLDVLKSLEGLDEQIERSLEGLDEQIEASLEGLDEQIERNIEINMEGLDEQIERSLEHLDDLDIDINIDEDNRYGHHDIEQFRREALKGANDDNTSKDKSKDKEKSEKEKSEKEKSKDKPKKDPKEN